MTKKIWFKNKQYGWGWYPATWEGWLVLLVFLILLGVNVFILSKSGDSPSENELIWFFVREFGLLAVLLYICFRTGEKPGWQWPARHASQGDAGGGNTR